MKIETALSFDDVLLVPKYSKITSRKEIDLTSKLSYVDNLSIPIISSPMDTVTEGEMATALSLSGGLGVIHRYSSIYDQGKEVKKAKTLGAKNIAVAVGVSGDFVPRATTMVSFDANIICVDIAHGHHTLMKKALTSLRKALGPDVHIMAGNVATLEGFNDLADWGANSIRVGIGGGSICSTRIQTGHGMPTLQSIIECAKSDRDAALIADGGIRNSGDIVKAIAAGADFVMLGSLLAGTDESPGNVVEKIETIDGISVVTKHKVYRGMASVEAQIDWRGHAASEEGVSSSVPYKGSVGTVLMHLEKGIRSGLSYSGVHSILEFQASSHFIRQTSAGALESSTHILSR